MNRRSILTSLSSMCLAALAWPRNAAGGGFTYDNSKSTDNEYTIRVKNAYVGDGGELVPGTSTLNVWAYGAGKTATLTGGAVGVYTQTTILNTLNVTIYAAFPEMPKQETAISITQYKNTTLYYLAYADSLTRTRRITITKAPPGVTF